MSLSEKQSIFSLLVSRFIEEASLSGFEVTLGEAWRSPETARLYEKEGKGISNSLHISRLAIDLNFFRDGKIVTGSADMEMLGELWESYSSVGIKCCWGGRFTNPDCDHFSIENAGIR